MRHYLEVQDLELFSYVAQYGSVEAVAFLLFRSSRRESKCKLVPNPSPTQHPIQYLLKESAYYVSAVVFRYLLTYSCAFLSADNKKIESVLFNAVEDLVSIWQIILKGNSDWKDYQFSQKMGSVISLVVQLEKLKLLDYLLNKGADLNKADDVRRYLTSAYSRGAELTEVIKEHRK